LQNFIEKVSTGHKKKLYLPGPNSGTMKWYNSLVDEPPLHMQEVVISVDGIYYLAIYNAQSKRFDLRDEARGLEGSSNLIYWTHASVPGAEQG
jgi:hypothetical protein